MKKALCLIAGVVLASGALAQDVGKVKPTKKTSFREVAKHLNPDGDFYMYLNSAEFVAKATDVLDSLEKLGRTAAAAEGGEMEQVDMAFRVIRKIVNESGLLEMRAVGMSSVERSKDLHFHNVVLYHGTEDVNGKVWEMIGKKPQPFNGLNLMPEKTVVGATGTFDVAGTWNWITEIVNSSGEMGRQSLAQMRKDALKEGVDVDKLMNSFSGQMAFSVTMDPSITYPASPDNPELQIPDTAFLLAFSVKDHSLYDLLAKQFEGNPNVERPQIPGVTALAMPFPAQIPVKFKPTLAKTEGLFLFGSNPKIVEEAMAVKVGGRGLVHTPEFGAMTQNLPRQGNQMFFVSEKIGKQVQKIMKEGLAAADDMEAEQKEWVEKMMLNDTPMRGCVVTVHQPDAMVAYANSSVGLAQLMLVQGTIVPTAVMAGMLLPALGQARGKARRVNCAGNLKQLGLGLIIYAGDDVENGKFPHSWNDLAKGDYLPAEGGIWDCPSTDRKTMNVASTEYVYLGAGLKDTSPKPSRTIVAHSPPADNWINFLFVDGHVQGVAGSDAKAIAKEKGWSYGKE